MAGTTPLLVVIGATASGKSAVAMEVARRRGAEILSVDSMQVYRGMDIGTAKPTPAERAQVPHHLLDVADPSETFTVARFVALADEAIAQAAGRGVPLVAVGGTPMYHKALFQGLFEGPAGDPHLRRRLQEQPNESLHRRLSQVDPLAAGRIHLNDTKRLIRALEVFELTGQPISSLQTAWEAPAFRYPALWIGLHWDRDVLNRRINARVKQMLASGWLDEAATLKQQYGSLSPTAGEATGYAQLLAHLAGKVPLDEAAEQIKIATRQLARRQMKWFRRFPNVHWLAGDQPVEQLAELALARWESQEFPR